MAHRQTDRIVGGIFLVAAGLLFGRAGVLAQALKPSRSEGALTVGNESGKIVSLSGRAWQKLPRRKVDVKDREGATVQYEGVSLAEVLRFAGVPFKGHLRGPRVASYVLIEASDGYRAVFALAEVDPSVADKVILLADRQGGKPLPEASGPYRLIVPGDKTHSRWVRQVIRITIQRPPESGDRPAPKK